MGCRARAGGALVSVTDLKDERVRVCWRAETVGSDAPEQADSEHSAVWWSPSGSPPPRRIVVADDRMRADDAWRLACEGTALLWQGDYHNARQLLQAMDRRIARQKIRGGEGRARKGSGGKARGAGQAGRSAPVALESGAGAVDAVAFAELPPEARRDVFNRYRLAQAQRARLLGMVLLPLERDEGGLRVPLRRAPEIAAACAAVGEDALPEGPAVIALRELLGLVGAWEWRRKGVEVAALGDRVHPHYGVFAPVRGEYVELVAQAPLPAGCERAFDIGTGTGVLAAVLARRGVARVIATDTSARALACAGDNLRRLGLDGRVERLAADLFPPGRAPLVVCNPPWLPGKARTPLEQAVYDPDSRMLYGFLDGLAAHLEDGGEGWLILSDLAERLGLRSREALLQRIADSGLVVIDRLDRRPGHARTRDAEDPLHAARAAEVTSLWRLGIRR